MYLHYTVMFSGSGSLVYNLRPPKQKRIRANSWSDKGACTLVLSFGKSSA